MKFNFSDNYEFESFVRKIAAECWGTKGYSGPITIDGKERDGVLENDHMIYCLEVTFSKTAKHTLDACKKLDEHVRRLRGLHPDKGVTGWYITRFEPTGEQGAILQSYRTTVNHRTYEAFYANMVDAKEYLIERPKKPFGSIRHPKDGSFASELTYTPTNILDLKTGDYTHTGGIAKRYSKKPTRALIVGEFGAGKSMALRDIFQRLSKDYRSGNDSQFPVYINLRDHIEQYDPDECLRRHASSVGMSNPEKLIKAWRSGLVYLLLDGFDELAPRIATSSKKRAQDLRNSAISLGSGPIKCVRDKCLQGAQKPNAAACAKGSFRHRTKMRSGPTTSKPAAQAHSRSFPCSYPATGSPSPTEETAARASE